MDEGEDFRGIKGLSVPPPLNDANLPPPSDDEEGRIGLDDEWGVSENGNKAEKDHQRSEQTKKNGKGKKQQLKTTESTCENSNESESAMKEAEEYNSIGWGVDFCWEDDVAQDMDEIEIEAEIERDLEIYKQQMQEEDRESRAKKSKQEGGMCSSSWDEADTGDIGSLDEDNAIVYEKGLEGEESGMALWAKYSKSSLEAKSLSDIQLEDVQIEHDREFEKFLNNFKREAVGANDVFLARCEASLEEGRLLMMSSGEERGFHLKELYAAKRIQREWRDYLSRRGKANWVLREGAALKLQYFARKLLRVRRYQKLKREGERREQAVLAIQGTCKKWVVVLRAKKAAAKKIWVFYRNYSSTKDSVCERKRIVKERNVASMRIQAFLKMVVAQKALEKLRKRYQASICIQRYARGYLGRKMGCKLKAEKAAKEMENRRISALIIIQKHFRMHRCRKMYIARKAERHFARNKNATKIQAWIRHFPARRAYLSRLAEYRAKRKYVVFIQSYWRMFVKRREYLGDIKRHNAAILIQSKMRMYLQKRSYNNRLSQVVKAVKVIQKWILDLNDKKRKQRLEMKIQKRKNSSIVLQRWYRKFQKNSCGDRNYSQIERWIAITRQTRTMWHQRHAKQLKSPTVGKASGKGKSKLVGRSDDENGHTNPGKLSEHTLSEKMDTYYGDVSKDGLQRIELKEEEIDVIDGLDAYPQLQSLCLNSNRLVSMQGIENASNIRSLDLQFNSLAKLSSLESAQRLFNLNVHANNLQSLKYLASLPYKNNLKCINANNNAIEDTDGIESCQELHKLELYRNGLKSECSNIGELSNLVYLDLGRNSMTQMPDLHSNSRLMFLFLYQNNIKEVKPNSLGDHVLLRKLWLNGNNISSFSLSPTNWFPLIQSLQLNENELTSIGDLSPLITLKHLDLSFNSFTSIDNFLCSIRHCKSLQKLLVNDNFISNEENYPHLRSAVIRLLPSLKELDNTIVAHQDREEAFRIGCNGAKKALMFLNDKRIRRRQNQKLVRGANSNVFSSLKRAEDYYAWKRGDSRANWEFATFKFMCENQIIERDSLQGRFHRSRDQLNMKKERINCILDEEERYYQQLKDLSKNHMKHHEQFQPNVHQANVILSASYMDRRQKCLELDAIILIQSYFRGFRVRKWLSETLTKATYMDEDDFDYAAVDLESLDFREIDDDSSILQDTRPSSNGGQSFCNGHRDDNGTYEGEEEVPKTTYRVSTKSLEQSSAKSKEAAVKVGVLSHGNIEQCLGTGERHQQRTPNQPWGFIGGNTDNTLQKRNMSVPSQPQQLMAPQPFAMEVIPEFSAYNHSASQNESKKVPYHPYVSSSEVYGGRDGRESAERGYAPSESCMSEHTHISGRTSLQSEETVEEHFMHQQKKIIKKRHNTSQRRRKKFLDPSERNSSKWGMKPSNRSSLTLTAAGPAAMTSDALGGKKGGYYKDNVSASSHGAGIPESELTTLVKFPKIPGAAPAPSHHRSHHNSNTTHSKGAASSGGKNHTKNNNHNHNDNNKAVRFPPLSAGHM
eukprot:Nk52_evm14s2039 gene=Nk52_evmTU14s2039